MFADDTSLFSVVHNDLEKNNRWAYQWKMSFKPHSSKQAQEAVFSRKSKKEYHPHLAFNNSKVLENNLQKHNR